MAVALIFAIWQRYFRFRLRQEQVLRHRIAYLLWVVAEHAAG
jgi:hypothetical protein